MTNNQPNQIQQHQPQTGIAALKNMINNEVVQKQFQDMFEDKKKATGFLTSVISAAQNNALLANAEPKSIILAASLAASMNLPINPNLGYAALIPYNENGKNLCQMQVMRNGWVDLALRTGKVERIVNELVYEGELVSKNRFIDEYVFDETKRVSDKVIGAMAYIKTASFEKTVFWTTEQCMEHGKRYSKVFKKGKGLWVTNPESMMLKTVIKHLITKYAPKSIELEKAIESDQAVFQGNLDNLRGAKPMFVDNDNSIDTDTVDFEEVEIIVEPTDEEIAAQQQQDKNDATEPTENGELNLQ